MNCLTDSTDVLAELQSDIAAFRHYLQSERGMADNTVRPTAATSTASRSGAALVRYADYTAPTLKDLARYLAFLHDEQLAAAEHRPAPRRAQDVLPLPPAGGAGRRRGGRSARLAEAVGAHPAGAAARPRWTSC